LAILAQVTWPWAQQDEGILLKFLSETTLEFEYIDFLIGFLVFLVQRLFPKNNQLIKSV